MKASGLRGMDLCCSPVRISRMISKALPETRVRNSSQDCVGRANFLHGIGLWPLVFKFWRLGLGLRLGL